MKINMKYIVWICAMLVNMMGSRIITAKSEEDIVEMQTQREVITIEKRRVLQEQHEQQKQSARTSTWLARFRNSSGPLRLEATTELAGFLSGSSSLQEIEELLGNADEKHSDMWRYRVDEKEWLEITIDTEQQISQIALALEGMTSNVNNVRLYDGTPIEDIIRAWGKPHRKNLGREHEIWFYQFDGDGIWKLLILNRSLKRATYAIIPKGFHSPDRQRLSVATNEPPVISDIDVAIVEFKTADRKKAAPILMPLIQKGVTTQNDVVALLGAPDMISEDRQTYSYTLWYSELLSISFNQYGFVENIFP